MNHLKEASIEVDWTSELVVVIASYSKTIITPSLPFGIGIIELFTNLQTLIRISNYKPWAKTVMRSP